MRTVRLVRGVVFLRFPYWVCLSWVSCFFLTVFASRPLVAVRGFLFCSWVCLLSVCFFVSSFGFALGFFLGFFLGLGLAVVVLWSCCGRAVVVLWSCCGRAVVVGVAAFLGVFLPPGVFPGGACGLWLVWFF